MCDTSMVDREVLLVRLIWRFEPSPLPISAGRSVCHDLAIDTIDISPFSLERYPCVIETFFLVDALSWMWWVDPSLDENLRPAIRMQALDLLQILSGQQLLDMQSLFSCGFSFLTLLIQLSWF